MADFPAELLARLQSAIGNAVSDCDNGPGLYAHETESVARAALSALPPGAQAVLRGEAVAVPLEPTDAMLRAAAKVDDDAYIHGSQHGADDEQIYYAMLAASPYEQEPR